MAVGRNDPCPCGSGRKYKNCCMRREQVQASQRHSGGMVEQALRVALYEYALQARDARPLDASFEVFWGGHYDPASAQELDEDSVGRWLEWYTHEYRVDEERRRPIEMFLAGTGRELSDEMRELLAAWEASLLGLYRVEQVQGERLTLTDLLREEPLEALDPVMARSARPRDLLVARTYRLHEQTRLSPTTLLLPPDVEPGLVEYVRNAYRGYQQEHGRATWDTFLRAESRIFMAFLLSSRGDALRTLAGPGTRYSDPARTRDKLRAFTLRRQAEREAEARQAQEQHTPEHRTASGLILPGAEEAVPAGEHAREQPARPTILLPGRGL